MEIQELRLGNYYRLQRNNEAIEDMKIDIWTLFDFNKADYIGHMSHCFPITLTEEWLEKFGFTKEQDWYTFGNVSIDFEEKRCVQEVGKTGMYNQLPYPQYVHKLQNLYYALTNKELTVL